MISYTEKLLKLLRLEDRVIIGETHNEEAFRLICEEVEKLVCGKVKEFDTQITLYVPKELVEDVGALPKVKNLNYISTTKEEHPKDFNGKIVMVFTDAEEVSPEMMTFGNVIIELVESFIRKGDELT